MSGTDKNPYPKCIKCNTELSPQDSRGWEKISCPDGKGINLVSKDIWLCPNCIGKFQHAKDLVDLALKDLSNFHSPITDNLMKIHAHLHKINDKAGN